ncbi:hypothetical protein L3Q82_026303 [Scortum barcoo]|uniref:Uncharacterized protein n=1 Tax=Scortum barcoo TaxID=214431 RepID=A0ACB8WL94_9TELE|nr:hypothetical protein L3Q82_026303 [Scortum barcoo]
MPPGRLPREVFQACPHREEASGKTQDTLEKLCLSAGLGTPRGPPGRAGGSVWGEGSLGISAQTAASATRSRTKRMKKKKKEEEDILFPPSARQCLRYQQCPPNTSSAAAIPHCCTEAEDALYCGPVEVCQELRGESSTFQLPEEEESLLSLLYQAVKEILAEFEEVDMDIIIIKQGLFTLSVFLLWPAEGHICEMLFIDYSSAFNTIVPSKLVTKLRDLGLNSALCDWILNFLTGRPQAVQMRQHPHPPP